MSTYRLSAAAEDDLLDMLAYGAWTFGAPQSRTYYDGMLRSLDTLATFPMMCRLRTEFAQPVRIHHHIRHYIAYIERDDHVFIIRIVRDEADLDRLFDPF